MESNPIEDPYFLHAKRMLEKIRMNIEKREEILKEIHDTQCQIDSLNIAFQNDYALFSKGQEQIMDDQE